MSIYFGYFPKSNGKSNLCESLTKNIALNLVNLGICRVGNKRCTHKAIHNRSQQIIGFQWEL